MTYMAATKAPLLSLQGDNDIRVPRGQAEEVEAVLKANGVTSETVFYPAEGHGFQKAGKPDRFLAADNQLVRTSPEGNNAGRTRNSCGASDAADRDAAVRRCDQIVSHVSQSARAFAATRPENAGT